MKGTLMKQKLYWMFGLILALILWGSPVRADDVLKIGMEAGYAPFNWTQNTDENGAVPIEGTSQYANGYDVQMAKKIAQKMGKSVVVVKTRWDGLVPALTSGKIDLIVAGMSPTPERREAIDFTDSYYRSEPLIVVRADSPFAKAKSLADFKGARLTSQQGVYLYNLIDQIPGAQKETAMGDFSQMRQSLTSDFIDGYVSERPEAMSATSADASLRMIELEPGFQVSEDDVALAIGIRKGDARKAQVNAALASIPEDTRRSLMDEMIRIQPSASSTEEDKPSVLETMFTIVKEYWKPLLAGVGMTLLISLVGTLVGLLIGLLIGVYRTAPQASHPVLAALQRFFGWLLTAYIEVFRGTPMMVQAMIIFYGSAQLFGWHLDRLFAALFIVSINTGAYMSEIVRGGIQAVDKGQFEAATALGFTHWQTMRKIVLPQVIRHILPATGNEFVINIKDTSVLNIISVVELYFTGNTIAQQTYQSFPTFFIIAIIYFILTFVVTQLLRMLERAMDKDHYTSGGNRHV